MSEQIFITKGGITVKRTQVFTDPDSAMTDVYKRIDQAKGCILASDYDYPGRYSRWDIGIVDPPVEMVSTGRDFTMRALNDRGIVLLQMLQSVITGNPDIDSHSISEQEISARIKPGTNDFPEELRSRQPSVFSILRALCDFLACDDEFLTVFGAFGYDLVFQFEPINLKHDRLNSGPDCHLFLADRISAIDHRTQQGFKLAYEFEDIQGRSTERLAVTGLRRKLERTITTTEVKSDHQPDEYADKVQQIREGCHRGDFFEVVLSQEFSVKCGYWPTEIFSRLRKHNPSPYDFLFNFGDEQLIGASPEMFVRVKNGEVETCPISGTIKRGANPMEDAENIQKLLASRKDESELTMCTDVDRNDKSRICEPGSVRVIARRLIETYSKLFHTVDHVKGTLKSDCDMFDAFLSHMWACTLTGAPKPIAMQTIENMENSPRRWYGGCVGLFTMNGQLNTGITIRTVHLQNGVAKVRAGATLLYDSNPADEEIETRVKARAFIEAVTSRDYERADTWIPDLIKVRKANVLFVDNRDSFVHTLANYVRQTGVDVTTLRCGFDPARLDELKPDLVFISPGPGTPEQLGVPNLVGEVVKRNIPLTGVCLGHQGIAQYFGAELGVLDEPVHGKESFIKHNETGIFRNIPDPFKAGRYHSLYVKKEGLPDCLEVLAESDDGVIMSIRHKTLPIVSIQFHPESIMTLQADIGLKIITNIIEELTRSKGVMPC